MLTLLLSALNRELVESKGVLTHGVKVAHDAILAQMRTKKKNSNEFKYPTPDWDRYPVARSFFTQHYA